MIQELLIRFGNNEWKKEAARVPPNMCDMWMYFGYCTIVVVIILLVIVGFHNCVLFRSTHILVGESIIGNNGALGIKRGGTLLLGTPDRNTCMKGKKAHWRSDGQ